MPKNQFTGNNSGHKDYSNISPAYAVVFSTIHPTNCFYYMKNIIPVLSSLTFFLKELSGIKNKHVPHIVELESYLSFNKTER